MEKQLEFTRKIWNMYHWYACGAYGCMCHKSGAGYNFLRLLTNHGKCRGRRTNRRNYGPLTEVDLANIFGILFDSNGLTSLGSRVQEYNHIFIHYLLDLWLNKHSNFFLYHILSLDGFETPTPIWERDIRSAFNKPTPK